MNLGREKVIGECFKGKYVSLPGATQEILSDAAYSELYLVPGTSTKSYFVVRPTFLQQKQR